MRRFIWSDEKNIVLGQIIQVIAVHYLVKVTSLRTFWPNDVDGGEGPVLVQPGLPDHGHAPALQPRVVRHLLALKLPRDGSSRDRADFTNQTGIGAWKS